MTDADHIGTPAAEVIAKLERRLHAALDSRGLRRCPNCQVGILKQDVRDVHIVRQPRTTTVRNIRGLFCDKCGEIEFDPSTDSACRFAAAGDRLVHLNRAKQKWRSLNPKYRSPQDGFALTLWHALRETWRGYFAPVLMGAWLLKYSFTRSTAKPSVHRVGGRTLTVMALWDSAAEVWVAWSPDVPGLITEAASISELSEKLKTLVPELLVANVRPTGDISFAVIVTQWEDLYPPDDGPLSEQQIAALRADVQKHFPRGKLIARRELFK